MATSAHAQQRDHVDATPVQRQQLSVSRHRHDGESTKTKHSSIKSISAAAPVCSAKKHRAKPGEVVEHGLV